MRKPEVNFRGFSLMELMMALLIGGIGLTMGSHMILNYSKSLKQKKVFQDFLKQKALTEKILQKKESCEGLFRGQYFDSQGRAMVWSISQVDKKRRRVRGGEILRRNFNYYHLRLYYVDPKTGKKKLLWNLSPATSRKRSPVKEMYIQKLYPVDRNQHLYYGNLVIKTNFGNETEYLNSSMKWKDYSWEMTQKIYRKGSGTAAGVYRIPMILQTQKRGGGRELISSCQGVEGIPEYLRIEEKQKVCDLFFTDGINQYGDKYVYDPVTGTCKNTVTRKLMDQGDPLKASCEPGWEPFRLHNGTCRFQETTNNLDKAKYTTIGRYDGGSQVKKPPRNYQVLFDKTDQSCYCFPAQGVDGICRIQCKAKN
ncbi:MAG: prepilin-type N-terminal cleavage/methylation domain-containing protein [Bdellovibrio sp.]|nr:MAG: prepilin-type N-terminal cleavage/methylation domain-containing protein [Bdellovibrio sp.]